MADPPAWLSPSAVRRRWRLRGLRRRCEARIRELPMPAPFDVRELCRLVADKRARPIRLVPIASDGGVLGMWAATDTADVICYEQATTRPHQDHIILHELSHLLCDHYPAPLSFAEHATLLLPDLDPAMVRRVLGRTSYLTSEEQEAELLASLIQRHAQALPRPRGRRSGEVSDRIDAALDWHEGQKPRRFSRCHRR
ncbi:hypothetical protein NLX83_34155 [Allokutzneria sp. A3M-2-11 16]|uniref:hypothetical protein n=1 Tax=Allokutzneria sp. A3M-2-11 16 TaxID=2962043 RepID=UPI0020B85A3A|nr:hypothetical protein [Allokutzneria sp. A3M-2-11 16]MCP3804323.1 hypothetical protein [Allokutzneria sp. A3M-2-11 16]